MGYIRHEAIIVTSWDRPAIEAAAKFAEGLGLQVIGPSVPVINSISTFLICPDGSKEGWPESDAGDALRVKFIRHLRTDAVHMEWAAVTYGDDDGTADVTDDAWSIAPA